MHAFIFSEQWTEWVMKLVSSTFFSILVNETPSLPFHVSRGIRQVDPLSPFLFIIVVEGLNRMLKNFLNENRLIELSLNADLEPQTHQQFVDDMMLMGPSTIQEARGLKEGLDIFLEASGLKINKDESQVYFFNTPKITKRNILRILEFSKGAFPSKYLGAPLVDSTIRQILWKEQRVTGWSQQNIKLLKRS